MKITDKTVEISIDTWKELKNDPKFIDLVEFIEDREDSLELEEAMNDEDGFGTIEDLKKALEKEGKL